MSTLWGSVDGSIRNFTAMDDSHLANVLLHVQHYKGYPITIEHEIYKEIEARGLSMEFVKGAPYPWKHKHTGQWYIWSFDRGYVKKITEAEVLARGLK